MEFIAFWALTTLVALMLGYVYRGREVERLNKRVENLNALMNSLKKTLTDQNRLLLKKGK
jgi:hypothetical protein